MEQIVEVITAAMTPATRLIDAVTNAIGTAYAPKHMRDMADATAYRIETISKAIRNNSDLPIVCDGTGNITIDISNYEALAKRTGKRLAYQEIKKQENIEAIVDSAYESLQDIAEPSEGVISSEWMLRFLEAAGDISSADLQKLWSKVLAGEAMRPSSFSIRTLECLRNIEMCEAELFEKLCEIVVYNQFVVNDRDYLQKYGICYDDILRLDECGLINAGPTVIDGPIDKESTVVIDFGEYVLNAKAEKERYFSLGTFPLTRAGGEISTIAGKSLDFEKIKEICVLTQTKNRGIDFTLHKVNSRDEGKAQYDSSSISFAE